MELKERLLKAKDEVHGYKYSMPFNLSEQDIETLLHGLHYLETLKIEEPDLPAPNTVMWWLCRIADPEIRRKAVVSCLLDTQPQEDKELEYSIEGAIWGGWLWDEEDGQYWLKIAKSEIPLLPEPDFTEYNELRK